MSDGPERNDQTPSWGTPEDLEELAADALSRQVAHLRRELARAHGDIDDRDRTIVELREVIATRDEQIRAKEEQLLSHEAYIRRVTRWRRMVPERLRRTLGRLRRGQ